MGQRNRFLPAVRYWLPLVATLLTLAGCPTPHQPVREPPAAEPVFTRADGLFVPGAAENGRVRTVFETSNERYRTPEGVTLWTVWGDGSETFSSRTVTVAKPDGYSGGGYGMVFCHGEREANGVRQPSMLVVMVNNEGYYITGKAAGGVFTDFGWWKATAHLRRGPGAANELTVTYEEANGGYRLEINGHFAEFFTDGGEPATRGGKNGYIAVVTPFDRLPQSAVTVYFTEER